MKIKHEKKYRGSAIAYGLVVAAVASILLLSGIEFIVSQIKYSYYVQAREQAFHISEAGIQYYRWYLAHNTDGKTAQEISDFWTSTSPYPEGFPENPLEEDYIDPILGTIGKYRVEVTPPAANSNVVLVRSIGWTTKYPDIKRTIEVRFRRSSWSDFAVLTHETSRFDQKWEVRGKVMSNTGVHFDGVAYNTVQSGSSTYFDNDPDVNMNKPGVWTSWAGEINTYVDPDSNVFLAGKRFPVVKKDFIGVTADLNFIKTESQKPGGATINSCTASGCYFDTADQGRHIVLKSNGTFDISTVQEVKNNSNEIKKQSATQTFNIPNGAIFVNGNVWVEGTISNKRVTIVAAYLPNAGTNANIYVGMSNIKYTNYDGSDVIGLIAQGDVELSSSSVENLELESAVLAQNGKVWKKDYNPNCCGGGCEQQKNSIDIFGAVTSNKRIEFTQSKSSCPEKAVGFKTKKIEYDNNLLYYPPPYFPSDMYYTIDLWQEV